ncbi:hypothetical protein TWF281_009190 [Arthrobotrys megalospora]
MISTGRGTGFASPGGQNVNKVSTKATLRVPLAALEPHIPKVFMEALVENKPKYLTDTGDLVISSDSSRSQLTNTKACWEKLYQAVINSKKLPGITSPEKKERVKKLEWVSNENRLKSKDKISKKKAGRRGPVGEW